MSKKSKVQQPQTTVAQLSAIVKACRDIMRKDKGLNGDVDRLPMLTWIMFLKFLDDMEIQRETEAKLEGNKYSSAIRPPYRWRDWAAKEEGITGEELISFINNQECVRPDGTRGPGVFTYLRMLEGTGTQRDRRNVIATVFRGTVNRMLNGYLLRDVINKINQIHFTSSDEIHTLSHLYESLLKEMQDAAGDAGEFYTPRPVIKFMVQVVNPRLGETILDPACGTGGFLVETFEHIKKQCKTIEDHKILQEETIFGGEAKSLPYLLSQMNLLLHGLDAPVIDPGNSLRHSLKELGDKDRVDVILTNPPFGGEEEKGIQGNFPEDKQTGETALLFLQLIMRKLRRPGHLGKKGGRAGVVVPNGTLFGDGVCARIKEELLKEFNLHTIVRLPNGVFTPYTNIPTNLLFFDRSGPTKEVWYYEHPLPEGRKNYSKTKPIQFDEFKPCLEWWKKREENERAWKVKVEEVLKYDEKGSLISVNLDIKNPNAQNDYEHMPPEKLVEYIFEDQEKVGRTLQGVNNLIHIINTNRQWPVVNLGEIIKHRKKFIFIDDTKEYKRCRVQLYAQGIVLRDKVSGAAIKTKKQQICKANDFLVAEIDAKVGGYGIVPAELEGAIVSSHYFLYEINEKLLMPRFLDYFTKTLYFRDQVTAKGSTNYAAIRPYHVLDYKIPLPTLSEQQSIVEEFDKLFHVAFIQNETTKKISALLSSTLDKAFKGES